MLGKIKKKNEENVETGKWEIHFLRKSYRTGSTFTDTLSKNQVSDDVDEEDILGILPHPTVHRGIFKFAFDFGAYAIE